MIGLFAPSIPAGVGVAATVWAVWRSRPDLGARVLFVATAAVATGVFVASWILSLGFLAHLPVGEHLLGWCREALGAHSPLPVTVGLPSIAVAAAMTARCVGVVVRWRRIRENHRGGVEIVETVQPVAYTVPGRSGLIIVSRALMELLDDAERSAVLAHEAAHVRHRHDGYLLVAAFGSAAGFGRFLGASAPRV